MLVVCLAFSWSSLKKYFPYDGNPILSSLIIEIFLLAWGQGSAYKISADGLRKKYLGWDRERRGRELLPVFRGRSTDECVGIVLLD